MLYFLRLEWMKFRHYRVFQIMIAGFAILLPGILLAAKSITSIPPELGSTEMFFIFPTVWKYLAYIGSWLVFFFLGFLGVLSMTTEFANKTLRQNIITGLTRKEVFVSKFLSMLAISAASTIYLILCGLVIGAIHTETIYLSKVLEESGLIFRFFLMCLGYMIYGLLIGTLLRRTGLALFAYLTIAMFVEPVFRWAVHKSILPGSSMHFYPLNALEDLAPIPIGEIPRQFMEENGFDFYLDPTIAAITVSVYSLLFLTWIYRKLQTSDL